MQQIREFRSNFENISRDCRAIVVRLSHNICERRSRNLHMTVARQSCEIFCEKICIKFFNMLKNFATSSRLVRDTRKFSRHSHECRAKVCDKIRKTVARNSHASEILALQYILYIQVPICNLVYPTWVFDWDLVLIATIPYHCLLFNISLFALKSI